MTPEEKAEELGKKYSKPCHGLGDCEFEATQAALEMAQWKDQQFEEEKKRWIEKACKWFDEEKACFADDEGDWDMDFNEEFKKSMLEE